MSWFKHALGDDVLLSQNLGESRGPLGRNRHQSQQTWCNGVLPITITTMTSLINVNHTINSIKSINKEGSNRRDFKRKIQC